MSVSLREGGTASLLLQQDLYRYNGGSQPVTEFAISIGVGLGLSSSGRAAFLSSRDVEIGRLP